MNELVLELKQLIIDALMLEDTEVADIDSDAPLFREGLGLDSIDALELSIAIHKRFGVKIEADDEKNREIFASAGSLGRFIFANRSQ